ncbi:helix-turn-helix transcriptional regulator [Azospirillum sp.]|uniref:helix-turn-helix domain-containing protein n=1 Tax=Azospirillum sp. TaxID=34012 RepID=UPI002D59D0F5|nr:helix-turn-helix transcriptional regulator [Azospirillum sp.]HYD68495.1 helix-turn-helix transcriptional regulator [Azospirillum sp.]
MTECVITPEQSRAGRALLGWSQQELAARAKVAKQTLADFERGARNPYYRTLTDIRAALETGGVAFIGSGETSEGGGTGVRLKQEISGSG